MKSKEAKQRQQIFFDTLDMIHSDKSLSDAVEASIEDLSMVKMSIPALQIILRSKIL